ncbi:MAG: LysM peptidoglycan-binding domain-containing protein, partial [Spirochaetes bacterium]|nr:LysM peptidoglycan-binding domain-containing protein [Spirochaetota bacterium]
SINTKIYKRLESVKILDHTRTLLIGSVLKLTGSDEKDLLQFFTSYLKKKISLKQLNFIEFSIFNNNIPLSSDIVFDLTDYFLFEKKAIFKKAAALNESLEDDFNEKTLLFLFFLSYRNDLSNENRELIFLIFQAFAPKKITNILKTHLFKGSINYKKNISLHRLKKQQTSLPFTGTSQTEETNIKKAPEQELSSQKAKTAPKVKPALEDRYAALWKSIKIPTFSDKMDILRRPGDLFKNRNKKEINISLKKAAGKAIEKTVPVKKKKIPAAALDEKSGFKPIDITGKKYIYITAISIVVIFLIIIFTAIPKKSTENSSFSGKVEPGLIDNNHLNKDAENNVLIEPEGEIGTTPHELYTIAEGDTLSHISKRYYNNANMYNLIAEENNIENPDWVFPGQIIVIPEIKDRSIKNGAED